MDSVAPGDFTDRLAQAEAESQQAKAELGQAKCDLEKAQAEREYYRKLYLEYLELSKRLEVGLLGQKSERMPANESQLTLDILASMLGAPGTPPEADGPTSEAAATPEPSLAAEPTATDPEPSGSANAHPTRRKPKGRGLLPDHLQRIDIELIPEEVQREGLENFERLPGEVSETLERRRASFIVLRVHRPQFIRKDRERNAETKFTTAEPLDLPIERGLAGPGLLADTIVSRYQDHLPYHRLEQIFGREGVHVAKGTMCGWHRRLSDSLRILIDAMWKDSLRSPYMCIDATGVLVQDSERCRRGHFWVVVAPERHVMYRYSAAHNGEAVDAMLKGYLGYLVADAHSVYDHLYVDGNIVEVGCWCHARRYFHKSLGSEPVLARQALALMSELFRLERDNPGLTPKQRKKLRQEHSKPVVERFFAWCEDHAPQVLDDTPISKAIGYARNQQEALQRFLRDGRLPLHNNISELHLRRQAVGRKNWLFVGNDDAAEVNTTFVTLLASAQMHGLEPRGYIRDLLCLLPYWPHTRLLELAPVNWRQTMQDPEAQQILAENYFRRAVIGEFDGHPPNT